ncbi:MAG: hypothetical protein IRZ07_03385 [Microbispora sp.]|nr:hypothetical protein [Microbispora sp.]
MHQIAPDAAGRSSVEPTHYHCYRWQGSGQQWEQIGKRDSLDVASRDRPPIRTCDWLIKSPSFIAAVYRDPVAARDWLINEWQTACQRAMHPVPDWVDTKARAARALQEIETGRWPTYSQWLTGGILVFLSVVGTDQTCH